jgi:WD repeat-containing protein 44
MPYLPDLNSYLHQSSLLVQAYPTTRITTKYSLPPKDAKTMPPTDNATESTSEKRVPAASLTLKTYHADSGICLKYKTDKTAEVGRLVTGLGKLAKREIIEMPAAAPVGGDKMDVDGLEEAQEPVPVKEEVKVPTNAPATGGGGKGKKKKGKK